GKPVAGVRVTAAGTTDSAVTDAAGHFELAGCPKGAPHDLTAAPPAGSRYFVAERRVADAPGLDPMTIDIDLLPGIVLSGRLTDAKTGRPMAGTVAYCPVPGNKALEPTRDASGTLHRCSAPEGVPTGADGGFALAVAPGPGIVMAKARN